MPRPGPNVTSDADTQPGSDSLFPTGFSGGGALVRSGSVGTGEIADGSVAAADLNLASVATALAARGEFTGTYAGKSLERKSVLRRWSAGAKQIQDLNPAATATVATISSGTSNPLGSFLFDSPAGARVTYSPSVFSDTANGRAQVINHSGASEPYAFSTDFYGSDLVLQWYCANAATISMWIWVDGLPTTAAPFTPGDITPGTGTTYYTRIAFASAGMHHIEVFWMGANLKGLVYPPGSSLSAGQSKPLKVAVLTDSYGEPGTGSTVAMSQFGWNLCRAMGALPAQAGQGGTGYVNNGGGGSKAVFGDANRIDKIRQAGPDLVIIQGTVNDDGLSGIQAAATQCYVAIATALPNALILVIGPECDGAAKAFTANRIANVQAVAAAAAAAPNVIGFIDPCGVATATPATYTTSANYAVGDVATYLGGVYQCVLAVTGAPASMNFANWTLVSFLNGTGNNASPTGNGSRDLFMNTDNTHLIPAGHLAYVAWLMPRVTAILAA